jgi:hypothetical protein
MLEVCAGTCCAGIDSAAVRVLVRVHAAADVVGAALGAAEVAVEFDAGDGVAAGEGVAAATVVWDSR